MWTSFTWDPSIYLSAFSHPAPPLPHLALDWQDSHSKHHLSRQSPQKIRPQEHTWSRKTWSSWLYTHTAWTNKQTPRQQSSPISPCYFFSSDSSDNIVSYVKCNRQKSCLVSELWHFHTGQWQQGPQEDACMAYKSSIHTVKFKGRVRFLPQIQFLFLILHFVFYKLSSLKLNLKTLNFSWKLWSHPSATSLYVF